MSVDYLFNYRGIIFKSAAETMEVNLRWTVSEVLTMNLPDSFYIALCMTILLVGAVYWVWTQIQYVQRKVNVLENIVYELKTLCSRPPDSGPIAPTQYPPAPSSVLGEDEDLLHERLSAEVATYAPVQEGGSVPAMEIAEIADIREVPQFATHVAEVAEVAEIAEVAEVAEVADVTEVAEVAEAVPDFSEPVFDMGHYVTQATEVTDVTEDLQPGGVGSGVVPPSIQSSLDTMTIKELRRLAQQKGISGANEMRKKELIEAIRAVPIESFLE